MTKYTKKFYNINAEQAILGSLFHDPEMIHTIALIIKPEDFYFPEHKIIFDTIYKLHNEHKPIDSMILEETLISSQQNTIDFTSLPKSTFTLDNIKTYAKIIKDYSLKRKLLTAAQSIEEKLYASADNTEMILSDAERRISNIHSHINSSNIKCIKSIMEHRVTDSEFLVSSIPEISGLPTGYEELDDLITGLHQGELTVLAGRPSMGKSTFALNLTRNIAITKNKPVAIFSLETSANTIVRFIIAAQAKVEIRKLCRGDFTSKEVNRINEIYDSALNAPIYIDDTPTLTVYQLRARSRLLKQKHDIQLLIVDYLQLLNNSIEGTTSNREQELAEITYALKSLAKELNIPVIVLSQLNRKPDNRSDHRPIMSDLRGSGSIEEYADTVALLHRPEYYNPEECPGQAEIIIAKQRHGDTDTINLVFIKSQLRFEPLIIRPEEAYRRSRL